MEKQSVNIGGGGSSIGKLIGTSDGHVVREPLNGARTASNCVSGEAERAAGAGGRVDRVGNNLDGQEVSVNELNSVDGRAEAFRPGIQGDGAVDRLDVIEL